MRRTIGGTLAAAALVGLAMPAVAGERERDRPRRHHRHHDDDKVTVGDVIASAVILGGLLALKPKRKPVPPPAPQPVALSASLPVAAPMTADEAAEACAQAAESSGAKIARVAQVGQVAVAEPAGEGWFVKGAIRFRDSYRDTAADERPFRCAIGTAGVPSVHFDGEAVATT